MKILFLQEDFPPAAKGGAGAVAYTLAHALREEGHEVFVITAVEKKEEEGTFDHEGLVVFRIYAHYAPRWRAYLSLYNPQTVKKMKKILDEVRPEVVHAHNVHYYLSYHALKLAKNAGANVFLTTHDVMLFHYGKLIEFIDRSDPSCEVKSYRVSPWQQMISLRSAYNPLRNSIIKYYLRQVSRVFAVSAALKTVLEHNGIGRVEVLHNGIDVGEWAPAPPAIERFKEEHGLGGKKIVLFGGRLSGAKGGKEALLAMERIAQKFPEAVLLVIGERGGYAQVMTALARERGIASNLIFTGWISGATLKAAYHASDVVVVPSICFDSLPTVVLEAMASHKPVIATCFGGAKEMVVEGESGYIVNPFDTHAVAEKIVGLLSQPSKAKQMGEVGYERVRKEFDLAQVAKRLIAIYKGVE